MEIQPQALASQLAAIVGRDHVHMDRPTNVVYAKDVMPYDLEDHNIPLAVVRPANSAEVAGILEWANRQLSIPWEVEPTQPLGIATWYTTAALRNIRFRPLAGKPDASPKEPGAKRE